MRAILVRTALAVTLVASAMSFAPAARANDMDPILSRMWRNEGGQLVARDDLYDGLALDLGFALAPQIHRPAETLGWSGFFLGLEATVTAIDNQALHFVCGIENLPSGADDGGDGACDEWQDNVDLATFVPAVHVRKGLPYSFELGFQIMYMANTELVAVGGEVRWAPLEGFRTGWMGFLPDVSFAFTGSYVMGSTELALGMLGGDVSLSYPFTISGQMTLTPYAGWQFMVVGADHEQVLNSYYLENGVDAFEDRYGTEASPYVSFHEGNSRNFGQELATLKFHRFFFGLRFLWERLAVTPQFAFGMPMEAGEADNSGFRFQFGLSVGSDF